MSHWPRLRHWFEWFCTSPTPVAIIILIHVLLLVRAAWCLSPTIDEPGHLAAGISYWRQGHVELYRVNPPLVRMIAAACPMAAGISADPARWDEYPTPRPEFPAGADLMQSNGQQAIRMVSLARMPVIIFSVLGAVCCGVWARELSGPTARFIAVLFWCTHPLVLAHGALITADVAAAATGICTARYFARWLQRPVWSSAMTWGVCLGISLCVKSLWCLLGPVWLLCWSAYRISEKRPGVLSELCQLTVGGMLALVIVNSIYLWIDVGIPLGELKFHSRLLTGIEKEPSALGSPGNRFQGTLPGHLPVPVAADYLEGMDLQRVDFEQGASTWFLGRKYDGPVYAFYPVTLILKTPVGMLLSVLLGILVPARLPRPDRIVMTGLVLSIVAVLGVHPTVNHVRYALPLAGFAAVWLGQAGHELLMRRSGVFCFFTTSLVSGSICSTVATPWHLSYMNEFVRPGIHAARCLADSQADWGQGLLALKKMLDRRPDIHDLMLAYYGTVPPASAGITFLLPPAWPPATELTDAAYISNRQSEPCPGWYAVSSSLLVGADGRVTEPSGKRIMLQAAGFRWLMQFEPVDVAGGSIFLFHITESDLASWRSRSRNGIDQYD